MNRRRFLQLSSGAIGYSLTSAASGAAVSSEAYSSKFASHASPQIIDRIWQKASAKYGPARAALLEEVDRRANDGPFRPDWESLATYQVPEWYKDAKFGIFVHWNVYSVPAFSSEWYPRDMYIKGTNEYAHQIATYGPLTKFGYKDFIPMFKAEHYNPNAWARLFKDSGARYVVPVFEHHDGFAMYDSALSDWTAAKMGPRRDLVGDLTNAVRAEGLRCGASSHRLAHDWFMDGGRKLDSDVNDPRYADFYGPAHTRFHEGDGTSLLEDWTYLSPEYASDWLARSAEITEKYHPDIMWFDWWIGHPTARSYLARFAAFYYNLSLKHGTAGVINYKYDAMQKHSAVLDLERGGLANIRPLYWQTDTSVSDKSWGYIRNDTFKSPEFIIHQLADIVSKNGNLLLNVGPRSDGTIPSEVQRVLLDVGSWLQVNGDAIYRTRPWRVYGEGPTAVAAGPFHDTETHAYTAEDFRFTSKGDTLYALELAWPSNGKAVIHSLGARSIGGRKIRSVALLGMDVNLRFEQQDEGLHIHVPARAPGKYAYAFKIRFMD
jgi:alpha-L-fucosidase